MFIILLSLSGRQVVDRPRIAIMLALGVSSVEDWADRGRRTTPLIFPGLNVDVNAKGGENEKNT